MSGLGTTPLGTGPYGLGTPATAPVPGGVPLRNATTGVVEGSRMIDPSTKDYVFDSYGRVAGMGNAQQLVLLAATTDRGTSALATLGQRLASVRRLSVYTRKRVETEIETAFAPLTARGIVELISVDVVRAGDSSAYVIVRWRDLTTDQEYETRL